MKHIGIIYRMMMQESDFQKICIGGDIDVVKSAIKDLELKNENTVKNWNDGLIGACKGGHLNVVELMIQQGADSFNWGLMYACRSGNLDIINLMIEKGAYYWDLGLVQACYGRHINIVKMMIERGAIRWNPVFNSIFDLIDSDIIDCMIKKGVCPKYYLAYPKDKIKMHKLYELGLPIGNFKNIKGFKNFVEEVKEKQKERQDVVKRILDD